MSSLLFTACAKRRVATGPLLPNSGSPLGDSLISRCHELAKAHRARGLTMTVRIDGKLPDMKKAGDVEARRTVAKDGAVDYSLLSQSGDATVRKELIARFMNGEIENSAKDDAGDLYLSPQNYRFKYRGPRTIDNRSVHVFDVTPREKRIGLFKGEVWIDEETAQVILETGRFVKMPSVWLKEVSFTREYTIKDGVAIPVFLQTSTKVRIYGKAELEVRYSGIEWSGKPSSSPS